MPRISVLTPTYNQASYLHQCIESVLCQSRLPDEFLILDDASTDHTPDVIRKYASQFPFIRHWRHEKNKGVGETYRELWEAATGDFIIGLSSDDAFLPGFLEKAGAIATQYPDVGMIIARHVDVREDWDYRCGLPAGSKMVFWKANGLMTPPQFLRATLSDANGLLAFGMAALLNRRTIQPHELCYHQLEQMQDVFPRLVAGARGGAYFLEHLGHAFRNVPNSICRSKPEAVDWLRIANQIAVLLMEPEYRDLFGATYGSNYMKRWIAYHRDYLKKSLDGN